MLHACTEKKNHCYSTAITVVTLHGFPGSRTADFDDSNDQHGNVIVLTVLLLSTQKYYHEHGYVTMLTNFTESHGSNIVESRVTLPTPLSW